MINELKLIENIEILFESKIVLYGAGYHGRRIYGLLKSIGISTSFFCESNLEVCGNIINGIEIISPQSLKQLDSKEETTIIITTDKVEYIEQIVDVIKSIELKTSNIFTMLGLEFSILQNINNPIINDKKLFLTLYYNKLYYFLGRFDIERHYIICVKQIIENIFQNQTTFLIYHPGKVGSSTICNSLNKINQSNIHMQFLSSKGLHNLNKLFFIDNLPQDQKTGYDIHNQIGNIHELLLSGKKTKIITLVREPIIRDLSWVFECIGTHKFDPHLFIDNSFTDVCVDWIKRNLISGYTYGYQFDWFDEELKDVFGVDVYTHPFDKEKGYSIIKQDNIEVLTIKLEKLNNLENVIGEFVDAPQLKLVNNNEGVNKSYKYLYENIRDIIKIPHEIVSLYYDNNPRMDHFYTEEEKITFLKKWENNIEKKRGIKNN